MIPNNDKINLNPRGWLNALPHYLIDTLRKLVPVLCAVELYAFDCRVVLDSDKYGAIATIGESGGGLQDLLDGVRDFKGHAPFELNRRSLPKFHGFFNCSRSRLTEQEVFTKKDMILLRCVDSTAAEAGLREGQSESVVLCFRRSEKAVGVNRLNS
jgi:hypothetical protein